MNLNSNKEEQNIPKDTEARDYLTEDIDYFCDD